MASKESKKKVVGADSTKLSTSSTKVSKELPVDKKDRAAWTPENKEILLFVILDHVEHMVEGGFKNQWWNQITARFNESAKECYSSDQIQSMGDRFKAIHQIVSDLLSVSGFGWNDELQMVTAGSDAVWNEYISSHPGARYFKTHSIPNYNIMAQIYEGKHATGSYSVASGEVYDSSLSHSVEFGLEQDSAPSRMDYTQYDSEDSDNSDVEGHQKQAAVPVQVHQHEKRSAVGPPVIPPKPPKRTHHAPNNATTRNEGLTAALKKLTDLHEKASNKKTVYVVAVEMYDEMFGDLYGDEVSLQVKDYFSDHYAKAEMFVHLNETQKEMFMTKLIESLTVVDNTKL